MESTTQVAAPAPPGRAAPREAPRGTALARLALGALGVVYGDIGTSPLYAVRECFGGSHGVAPTPQNVLGVISLVFLGLPPNRVVEMGAQIQL